MRPKKLWQILWKKTYEINWFGLKFQELPDAYVIRMVFWKLNLNQNYFIRFFPQFVKVFLVSCNRSHLESTLEVDRIFGFGRIQWTEWGFGFSRIHQRFGPNPNSQQISQKILNSVEKRITKHLTIINFHHF